MCREKCEGRYKQETIFTMSDEKVQAASTVNELTPRDMEELCCLAVLASVHDTVKLQEIFTRICVLKDNWWRSGKAGGAWFTRGYGATLFKNETDRRINGRSAVPSRAALESTIRFDPTITDYNRKLGDAGLSLLLADDPASKLPFKNLCVFTEEMSKAHERICAIFEKEIREICDAYRLLPMSDEGERTLQYDIKKKIVYNAEVEKEMRYMFDEIERRWREDA